MVEDRVRFRERIKASKRYSEGAIITALKCGCKAVYERGYIVLKRCNRYHRAIGVTPLGAIIKLRRR